jgi:lipopolysaccharide export system protein LptC
MSPVPMSRSLWMRLRQTWDRLAVYFPIFLMGLMAMSTYWLVRNTPLMGEVELEAAPRHVPDYFMRDFSVRVFGADGKLKSEILGAEGRHYPDTDTLEIDHPHIRAFASDGRITLSQAERGVINADGSEAQLFKKAQVIREALQTPQGVTLPRTELRSDFLHVFANTENVRSHLPVEMLRSNGDRFTADSMVYDNLGRVLELKGRVRGTLAPPSARAVQPKP